MTEFGLLAVHTRWVHLISVCITLAAHNATQLVVVRARVMATNFHVEISGTEQNTTLGTNLSQVLKDKFELDNIGL